MWSGLVTYGIGRPTYCISVPQPKLQCSHHACFSLGSSPEGQRPKLATKSYGVGIRSLWAFHQEDPALLFPYEQWVPLFRMVGLGWVVGKEWDLCVGLGGREVGKGPCLKSKTNEIMVRRVNWPEAGEE